jgi:hypothetical protein
LPLSAAKLAWIFSERDAHLDFFLPRFFTCCIVFFYIFANWTEVWKLGNQGKKKKMQTTHAVAWVKVQDKESSPYIFLDCKSIFAQMKSTMSSFGDKEAHVLLEKPISSRLTVAATAAARKKSQEKVIVNNTDKE